jgi:hypothetical protein
MTWHGAQGQLLAGALLAMAAMSMAGCRLAADGRLPHRCGETAKRPIHVVGLDDRPDLEFDSVPSVHHVFEHLWARFYPQGTACFARRRGYRGDTVTFAAGSVEPDEESRASLLLDRTGSERLPRDYLKGHVLHGYTDPAEVCTEADADALSRARIERVRELLRRQGATGAEPARVSHGWRDSAELVRPGHMDVRTDIARVELDGSWDTSTLGYGKALTDEQRARLRDWVAARVDGEQLPLSRDDYFPTCCMTRYRDGKAVDQRCIHNRRTAGMRYCEALQQWIKKGCAGVMPGLP